MTKTTTLERLKAERYTLSNRLSGTRTQLKRLGDDPSRRSRRRELERRVKELVTARSRVNRELQRLTRDT